MTIKQMIKTLEDHKSGFFKMVAMDCDLIADKLRELEHDLKNAMHNEGVFGNQVRKLEGDVMGWKTAYETERHEGLQLEARLKEMTDKKNIFMHAHDDLVVTVYELKGEIKRLNDYKVFQTEKRVEAVTRMALVEKKLEESATRLTAADELVEAFEELSTQFRSSIEDRIIRLINDYRAVGKEKV